MKLSEMEKVDADLRACIAMRERAREQLTEAITQLLTLDARIDVLLGRRIEAAQQ